MSDTVTFWLKNAARVPMLTAAQEITYGTQIRQWLDSENPDHKTIRRGQRAKERFIKSNLKLVISIAKRYTKRIASSAAIGFEDLLQEGCLGLNRAAEKFDPTTGYKFSTYAYWWISQAVARSIQVHLTTIKVPLNVQDTARKWRYRPEGQSLEDFASGQGRTPEWIMETLARFEASQPISLDKRLKAGDSESSTLADVVAHDDPSIESTDFADALEHLREVDDACLKDALAMLELEQQSSNAEMAELLGCSPHAARRKIRDMQAVVREHTPSHIREQIIDKDKTDHAKIEPIIPRFDVSPVQELVTVSACSSATQTMSEAMQNGHHQSLESEACAVIAEVRSETAVAEAPRPKRKRRSTAETQADKAAAEITVAIDGTRYEGKPEDIAAVVRALAA